MLRCTKKESKTISDNIRRIRVNLKLTQEQFARLIGVSQGQIAKYERGQAMPAAFIYLRIMAADPEKK
jgi:DNA-binding transcriptional regulator YiaG